MKTNKEIIDDLVHDLARRMHPINLGVLAQAPEHGAGKKFDPMYKTTVEKLQKMGLVQCLNGTTWRQALGTKVLEHVAAL